MSLAVFEFDSQEIRFVDDMPVAVDVAKALGYADPSDAIFRHIKEKNKTTGVLPVVNKEIIVLRESGIYQLIFRSKLESAERFQDWVFDEVLPSIRKTGKYQVDDNNHSDDYAHWNLEDISYQAKRNKAIAELIKSERELERLKPKETPNVDQVMLDKIMALLWRKNEVNVSVVKQYIRDLSHVDHSYICNLLNTLVEQGKCARVETKKGVKVKIKTYNGRKFG